MQETIEESERLFRILGKTQKFSNNYGLYPSKEAMSLAKSMEDLSDKIPEFLKPSNLEELIMSELKRRLRGEAANINVNISGRLYDFNTIMNIFGIPKEDLSFLKQWLGTNKNRTQEAVDRLFRSKDIEGYELPLALDIPGIRRQAEEFSGVNIQNYHKTIGSYLQGLTKVGTFLLHINAAPTTGGRSYFKSLTNTLAVSISDICFSDEKGILKIKDSEIIRILGHEGMGHALNHLITKSDGLPYFLTEVSALTISTMESVAQYYENVLLEDLKNSLEIQKSLGIEHKFTEIYQEVKDTEQIERYKKIIYQYGLTVLADKSFGDPNDPKILKKKAEILSDVAIDKSRIRNWVEKHRYKFDSEGNLDSEIIGELRYCARPVQRALEEFTNRGLNYDEKSRSIIDLTFLKGFWTPIGFVDNARIIAESKKS